MNIKTLLFKSFHFTIISFSIIPCLRAQQSFIKNYSVGFRIFEYSSVGNNPTTLAPQLKDPVSYLYTLNNFSYNSLYGNPYIAYMKNFYLNVEMRGRDSLSRFWKKNSIQAGILMTNRLSRSVGAVEDIQYDSFPDFIRRNKKYSYTEQIQFLGVNIGFNRRFKLSRNVQFLLGLQVQGSFAVHHNYKQQLDSTAFKYGIGLIYDKSTPLNDLKGKQYFQWQAMIPLGLEVNIYKQEFFMRLEAMLGIIGNSTRDKINADKQAHGVGIWLVYEPKRK